MAKNGYTKEHYSPEERGYLRLRPQGGEETQDGAWRVTQPTRGRWQAREVATGVTFQAGRRLDSVRQIRRYRGETAQGPMPTPIEAEPTPTNGTNGVHVPHSRKPLPREPEVQLALGRTPKLITVSLIEVEGRQVVVGFDGTSRAHTLWTEAK